jgi:pimeloyl-ACP methyl ester carboxylesterase
MFAAKLGSGPPVLLVHGLGAHSISWRDTAAALAQGHTTYAVDLLGFGRSPAPSGFACTMAAHAESLVRLITARALEDPVLIGHSMGGGICLRLAELVPVSRMILLAPVAYPGEQSLSWMSLGELGPGLQSPDFDAKAVGRMLAARALRAAYAPTSPVTPAQIDGYAQGLSTRPQIEAFVTHASKLDDLTSPAPRHGRIAARTLVIWGRNDPLLDVRHGTRLVAELPNATLQVIERCGHIPQEEQPAETNRLIHEFLAGSGRPR